MSSKKSSTARHWLESNPSFELQEAGFACLGLQNKTCGIFYPASGSDNEITSARLRMLFISSLALSLLVASVLLRSLLFPGTSLSLSSYVPHFSFGSPSLQNVREGFLHKLEQEQANSLSGQAAFISRIVVDHKVSRAQADKLSGIIVTESLGAGVDPLFTAAVIKYESTFKHYAVSHQGAKGLMQILPNTAYHIAKKSGESLSGAAAILDPRTNIRLGLSYIKYLESMFGGNRRLALMAYNWGPGNVLNALKSGGVPKGQVQNYADKILGTHQGWSTRYRAYDKAKQQLAMASSTDKNS